MLRQQQQSAICDCQILFKKRQRVCACLNVYIQTCDYFYIYVSFFVFICIYDSFNVYAYFYIYWVYWISYCVSYSACQHSVYSQRLAVPGLLHQQ